MMWAESLILIMLPLSIVLAILIILLLSIVPAIPNAYLVFRKWRELGDRRKHRQNKVK